ncbi:MAG TPA: TonB-dependent receptor [Flavobacteriales bacterium]|nr:TonB-dependent receptor [Flavobacteriales bacterium]HPH82085.1 TonB-dependent receptor [Flavobacteriales bacterium]
MKNRIFTCIFFLLIGLRSIGQTAAKDSVHQLPAFQVQDNRIPSSNPGLQQSVFSTQQAGKNIQSLAELLSRNSASFIRQYSPGTLSSPSIRGTGAAHTALVWNGLNLQSSMNGQMDLSLVPAILFDHFSLQSGAGAASWGTGAIGGTIHLGSEHSNNHLLIQQSIGSFGFKQTAVDVAYTLGRISFRTRLFQSQVENDFHFINNAVFGHPKQKQLNAAQRMKGWMQDLYWVTGKYSQLQLSVWGQTSIRQIPPIETIPIAAASQQDETWRGMLSWKRVSSKFDIQLKTGYLQEGILFNDSLLSLHAANHAKTYLAETEFGKNFPSIHSRFQLGGNFSYSSAHAQGYGSSAVHQERRAGFTSFRSELFKGKLVTLIQGRQEWFNRQFVPFIPSISASYPLFKTLTIRGQVARSFRVPTLNDLYWQPGGNLSLRPESGIASEFGLNYYVEKLPFVLLGKASVFSNQVKNWIVWLPSNSFWTPENVPQVHSRGLDAGIEIHRHFKKKQSLHFFSNAQYVWVTAEKSDIGSIVESGKQLVYVPHFTCNARMSYRWKGFQFELSSTYTGERFITSDNEKSLPGFFLLNAFVSKQLELKEHHFSFFLNAFNLLQKSYQVIAWRPMPLLSFQTGISFTFQPNPTK